MTALFSSEFERRLEGAVAAYRQRDYLAARDAFGALLARWPKDFSVNLWRLRTAVRLEDTAGAALFASRCKQRGKAFAGPLIAEWEGAASLAEVGYGAVADLNLLDGRTDEMLRSWQTERAWNLKELFTFALIFVPSVLVVAVLAGFIIGLLAKPLGATGMAKFAAITGDCLQLLLALYFLRRRIPLPPSWRRLAGDFLGNIRKLLQVRTFYIHLAVFLGAMAALFLITYNLTPEAFLKGLKSSRSTQVVLYVPLFLSLVLAPINEELLARKVLFNSLAAYNKIAAYIITAIVFAAVHFGVAHSSEYIFLFIKSLVFTWFYVRYSSIAAAIIVHAVNNLFAYALVRILL